MKKTLIILMIVSMVAVIFSCNKANDFLSAPPLGVYSEDAVWKDPALVQTFINSMYRNAFRFPFAVIRLSSFVDESIFTHDWGVSDFNKGLITPDNLSGWLSGPQPKSLTWSPMYVQVRQTNVFFSKIKAVPGDAATINGLKGQAYFMRAWTYFYMTNLFGGVPIITKAYTLNDNFEVPRNTYEDCINFIIGQCDSSAMYLPDVYPTDGHMSKGAALSLKAKVLLYAASDLHNPAKNSVVTSGFSNPELLGYTSGDATSRWTAARDAAKAVIDLGKYSLFRATPAPKDSVAQNFVDFFTSTQSTSEDILLQNFTPKTVEDDSGWEDGYNPGLYEEPNGWHCWSCNTPLGELVDDYEMKDGSKFDWTNLVEKANPYLNREARFYATILYEGVQWRERSSDGLVFDPLSKIQVGYVYDSNGNVIKSGLDTRGGPIETWNGGYTGYYLRKYLDPTLNPIYVKQAIPYKIMRYGEILLDYAEACIELAQYGEASTYINMIRTRAGQPNLPALTGDDLKQAYRHERRIELAYEDQRFWDVRRWLIGPEVYHQTSSIDVRYYTTNTKVDTYRQPDGSTWSAPVFAKTDTPNDARQWYPKCYFFPIMRSEMNKNTALIQNPGY